MEPLNWRILLQTQNKVQTQNSQSKKHKVCIRPSLFTLSFPARLRHSGGDYLTEGLLWRYFDFPFFLLLVHDE
jgi:hypothetical protein